MTDPNRVETGWIQFCAGFVISVGSTFIWTESLDPYLWKRFAVSITVPVGFFLLLLAAKNV